MNKQNLIVAVALAAIAPVAASASPGYDYVEAGYVSTNFSPGPTMNGFGLGGSFAINENFHVVGSWGQVKDSPFTVSEMVLGLGYNLGLSDTTDFVARAGALRGRVKITGLGSASENGWFLQGGFRSMLNGNFELNGFVSHADAGGSETSLDLGGVYHFTEQFGVTVGVSFSDDATQWQIGGRFSF